MGHRRETYRSFQGRNSTCRPVITRALSRHEIRHV
jgi:hypothetical protein